LKNKLNKPYFFALIFLILSLTLTGCQAVKNIFSINTTPISKSTFMLNTVITISIYDSKDETLLDKAFEVCKDYENTLSRTIDTSEISTLNNRPANQNTFTLSDKTAQVLQKGLYYSELSNGAFDITIAPLSSLWDFTSETPSIPLASDLKQAAQYVDYKNVSLKDNQISFKSPNTQFDLGAIAKGYIADKIKTYLTEQGVKSAVINLGGNILCIGNKPDGTPFKIGIQKPFEDRNETIGTMNISDLSVVSSGVYERHFIIDGVNYHHILNPKTGYPYNNGLISVTIISKLSVDGDGLSTTCFALGLDEGLKLINSTADTYAVFITDDYTLHYSEGAEALLKQ
jgi:thiamine biosynthesis lipoprotein